MSQFKASPPPSYASSLAGDDMDQPRRLRSISAGPSEADEEFFASQAVATTQHWGNEKSREELSGLLLKADELIKERENELDRTTAMYKTLYENNVHLKDKHKTLLARLPRSPSPSMSSVGSGTLSPSESDAPLPNSPHLYSSTSRPSSSHFGVLGDRPGHQRRITVSPSDLAKLSDQNAELIAKVEKLESDSSTNDQAGRKKLRNLEREIQNLRQELDQTRVRSDELEEKAKLAGEAKDPDEIWKRRQEREERLKDLKGKAETKDDNEIRDFAPGGGTFSSIRTIRPFGVARRNMGDARPRHMSEVHPRPPLPRDMSLPALFRRDSDVTSSPQGPKSRSKEEFALVSQLLLKIRELEEMNAMIKEQQVMTTSQLDAVVRDAATIRLAYETLGDPDEPGWSADSGPILLSDDAEADTSGEVEETIRFSSLRRSIDQGASTFVLDNDLDSSLRHAIIPSFVPKPPDPNMPHPHSKARKSVVGLFDSSPRLAGGASAGTPSQKPLSLAIPVPFPTAEENFHTPSTSPTHSNKDSPIPSTSSEVLHSGYDPEAVRRPTLESELSMKLEDSWSNKLDSWHNRSMSLRNLITSPPSPTDSIPGAFTLEVQPPTSTADMSLNDESPFSPSPIGISSSITSPDIRLGPGAWRGQVDSPPGRPGETAAEKQRRKSMTIRMRANNWKEARFTHTLPAQRRGGSLDLPLASPLNHPITPVPERLALAFDDAVGTISRASSESTSALELVLESSASALTEDDEVDGEGRALVHVKSGRMSTSSEHRGFGSVILELWLWLQFIVIIVVFLWAMARRGPKRVLADAERRKIQSA
ncbi:hypothetical protein CONPUDRAFT_158277 [Coniophora puteana RWD-64-598 SS2]|uniref:Uncharacterized protein n=1 Tax=Coniophora puteana (strain RWD-64-598) TaxID=741705 RepID=A0A5M3MAE4_CONPW|nr:uncharacterized protein CONPUDRAFT_158277 [Coniophora puteana RWD-64-598 SS2]EIW76252.1 hypothetical protein CONPUDRAFT_158277 [Coniophora puteana RWD-64-598 SS2]